MPVQRILYNQRVTSLTGIRGFMMAWGSAWLPALRTGAGQGDRYRGSLELLLVVSSRSLLRRTADSIRLSGMLL